MTKEYHFKKGMMHLGPYGADHMRGLVRQAELGRAHQVSIDGGATWQPASTFPELFQQDPVSPHREPLPAGKTIAPEWYFTIAGLQQETPVGEAELCELIRTGRVSESERVWNESLGDSWCRVADIPVLAACVSRRGSEAEDDEIEVRPRPQAKKRRRRSTDNESVAPPDLNVYGMSGFICSLVAVVLLIIPFGVWLLIAQSFFWIFNIVIPLGLLAALGLTLSVIGLRGQRRGLATAGTVLGVIAVSMAVMGIIGSATIRYRLATLRRTQIDGWAADIELARKSLTEALTDYRNLRPDPDEADDRFAIREKFLVQVVAARLRDLAEKYDGHLTATASTSEFQRAFEEGLPALRKAVQEVQQVAEQKGFALVDILPDVNANTDRLKLLLDTLNLYDKGRLTLPQVEGKMIGR
jgi:hypothetical protein